MAFSLLQKQSFLSLSSFVSLTLMGLTLGCSGSSGDRVESDSASASASASDSLGDAESESEDSSNEDSGQFDLDDDDGGDEQLSELIIDPGDVVLELDLGESTSVEFSVEGIAGNGEKMDLTDQVDWAVSNEEVGSFEGSTFSVSSHDETQILRTVVTATIDGFTAKAQVTVAAYQSSGANRDFFFVLPFNEGEEKTNELTFSTDVQALDVFFNMDTTVSMGEEIANLQNAIKTTIIPEIQEQIEDTEFGVGAFEDFPESPYGEICSSSSPTFPDQPFQLLQQVTESSEDVQNAVDMLSNESDNPIGCGGDVPEAWIESLYQIAVGGETFGPGSLFIDYPEDHSGIGGAGFRDGSLPVVVSITDAMSHAPGEDACESEESEVDVDYSESSNFLDYAHTRDQALEKLDEICGRVVTIASTDFQEESCGPVTDGTQLATATGARVPPEIWDEDGIVRPEGCESGQCCVGKDGAGVDPDADGLCPLVFRVDQAGSGVDASIVAGIRMLALYAPFDVTTAVEGDKTDAKGNELPGDKTSADFIRAIVPVSSGDPPLAAAPKPEIVDDHFENVTPGTEVTFDIQAFNDFAPLKDEPQLFEARIKVLAGTCSELDERSVFILIPPKPVSNVE